MGIAQNISDLRRAEEDVRLRDHAFNSSSSGIVIVDTTQDNSPIVYCNPAFEKLTGYSKEEVLGRNCRFLHRDDRDQPGLAAIRTAIQRGEEVTTTIRNYRKDGTMFRCELCISPVRDANERPTHYLGFQNDVTDRQQAQEALWQSETKLRELNASLERRVAERTAELAETNAELTAFAHTVSHDLRAPLRAMEGFAAALAEDYCDQLDEEAREFIQHIIDSARRMDTLINDLLVFSRLGRAELRLHAIGLDQIVAEARRQLSSEIEVYNAKLEVAEPMPTVLGHEASLVQVVANLLSNAMKFVAEGVRPEIWAWAERRDGGMVRLWVEDNGIGIEDTYRDRIFQVFERLHGIDSYPGTGIGLAIVARVCNRLGGRYGFESQRDQGSRFWVEFQEGDANP
jgi:PAS domain S-box-containing protein